MRQHSSVPVAIYEKEPTSIISYALSSREYFVALQALVEKNATKYSSIDECGRYSELLSRGVNLLGVVSSEDSVNEEKDLFSFKDLDDDKGKYRSIRLNY